MNNNWCKAPSVWAKYQDYLETEIPGWEMSYQQFLTEWMDARVN